MSRKQLSGESAQRAELAALLQTGHAAEQRPGEQERIYRECIAGWDNLVLNRLSKFPQHEAWLLKQSDVCPALSSLARLLIAQGRFAEAEGLARRLLDIAERNRREDKYSLAYALSTVIDAVGPQGRWMEVAVLTKREVALYVELGGGEVFMRHALCRMAQFWLFAGDCERAKECALEASRVETATAVPEAEAALITRLVA